MSLGLFQQACLFWQVLLPPLKSLASLPCAAALCSEAFIESGWKEKHLAALGFFPIKLLEAAWKPWMQGKKFWRSFLSYPPLWMHFLFEPVICCEYISHIGLPWSDTEALKTPGRDNLRSLKAWMNENAAKTSKESIQIHWELGWVNLRWWTCLFSVVNHLSSFIFICFQFNKAFI